MYACIYVRIFVNSPWNTAFSWTSSEHLLLQLDGEREGKKTCSCRVSYKLSTNQSAASPWRHASTTEAPPRWKTCCPWLRTFHQSQQGKATWTLELRRDSEGKRFRQRESHGKHRTTTRGSSNHFYSLSVTKFDIPPLARQSNNNAGHVRARQVRSEVVQSPGRSRAVHCEASQEGLFAFRKKTNVKLTENWEFF